MHTRMLSDSTKCTGSSVSDGWMDASDGDATVHTIHYTAMLKAAARLARENDS